MNKRNFEIINAKANIRIYNVPLDIISFKLANGYFCGTIFSQRKYERQKFWKNKHSNCNKYKIIYLCAKSQSIWKTSDFETKFSKKNMNEKKIWKNKHNNGKKHMVIYLCTKFQSIWRSSFSEQNLSSDMNEKYFEKINIIVEIRAWPSTSVPNFSQFEELQILGHIWPKIWMKRVLKK